MSLQYSTFFFWNLPTKIYLFGMKVRILCLASDILWDVYFHISGDRLWAWMPFIGLVVVKGKVFFPVASNPSDMRWWM